MSLDVLFLLGVYMLPFAAVSMISAWSAGRSPRTGGVMALIAMGLLLFVAQSRPAGLYDFRAIPEMTFSVIGRLLG